MARTNYSYNPTGSGVAVADRIGGADYPYTKAVWGADGVATSWSFATPAPVQIGDGTNSAAIGSGTKANALRIEYASDGTPITVLRGSGTWTVDLNTSANTIKFDQTSPNNQVKIDPTQLTPIVNNATPVITGGFKYADVNAGTLTAQKLTATGAGAVGDYLDVLTCIVLNPANSTVTVTDGNGSALTILPPGVAAGIGTYTIPCGWRSKNTTTPGWYVTTGTGVTVRASGDF